MFCYSNEVKIRKFEVENLINVARPYLKSKALNNLKNLSCTLCQTLMLQLTTT